MLTAGTARDVQFAWDGLAGNTHVHTVMLLLAPQFVMQFSYQLLPTPNAVLLTTTGLLPACRLR